jgi:amino acid transporter
MVTAVMVYFIVLFLVLALTFVIFYIKHRKEKQGEKKKLVEPKTLREIFLDKLEIFSLVLFIFAIFLLDVNANNIAAFGTGAIVTVFQNVQTTSVSMFWLGFLIGLISFIVFCTASISQRKGALRKVDLFFTIIGGVGLGIILSGGLLYFTGAGNMDIPIFIWNLSRTSFYHIGIGIEALTVLYFALTK